MSKHAGVDSILDYVNTLDESMDDLLTKLREMIDGICKLSTIHFSLAESFNELGTPDICFSGKPLVYLFLSLVFR